MCVWSQGGLRCGEPGAGTPGSPTAGANAGAAAGSSVPKPQCGGKGQAPAHLQDHGTCPIDLFEVLKIYMIIFYSNKGKYYRKKQIGIAFEIKLIWVVRWCSW